MVLVHKSQGMVDVVELDSVNINQSRAIWRKVVYKRIICTTGVNGDDQDHLEEVDLDEGVVDDAGDHVETVDNREGNKKLVEGGAHFRTPGW